jgi:hypothetical protein
MDRRFVKRLGLSLDNRDRTLRAVSQAISHSVAVYIGNQPRFAINDLKGALMARGHTFPTTITPPFINLDDLTLDHRKLTGCGIRKCHMGRLPQLNIRGGCGGAFDRRL